MIDYIVESAKITRFLKNSEYSRETGIFKYKRARVNYDKPSDLLDHIELDITLMFEGESEDFDEKDSEILKMLADESNTKYINTRCKYTVIGQNYQGDTLKKVGEAVGVKIWDMNDVSVFIMEMFKKLMVENTIYPTILTLEENVYNSSDNYRYL